MSESEYKMIPPVDFFYFCKNLIFWVRRVKGQKMVQNDKKNLSHSVSQELYHIWLWFLVHMCKMMIYPAIFSFFQNSDFFGFSRFINKCQKEILRCTPPSDVCDFFFILFRSWVIDKSVKNECVETRSFLIFPNNSRSR